MVTLPPGTISTLSGRYLDAVALVQVGRDRLAQGENAVRRGIAMLAVAQRLDGRLDDMRRRLEVGLADAKVDDVPPLALQLGGLRQHREGVLLTDAIECGYDVKHSGPPFAALMAKAARAGKTFRVLRETPLCLGGERGSPPRHKGVH